MTKIETMASYKIISQKLVKDYCNLYQIDRELLFRQFARTGRVKKLNGVHIDFMRMALSYFLEMKTTLSLPMIASICGYKCHSTICQNRDQITFYIEVEDPYFFPYWESMLELGMQVLPDDAKRINYKRKVSSNINLPVA